VIFNLSKRRRAVRPSPVFLGFLVLAVLGGLFAWRDNTPGSRGGDFAVFVMVLAAWVVSLSLHEFAHAYLAYRAGDRSVEAAGYLTLNPLKYAHPLLSIIIPLLFIVAGGIGLPGGAVYLHPHTFRSRAMRSAAAAAGPLTNVAFAVVTLVLVNAHLDGTTHVRFWTGLAFLGFLQVTAAVLNLLPIPGLDGWAVIEPYLDPETVRGAERIKPFGMLGVIVLLQVSTVNRWFFDLVYGIVDTSGVPRLAIEYGREFFRFWQRQPF
jgi:Zn-dependent protease